MIRIEFNGESMEIATDLSISQLLDKAKVASRYCAVELNMEILPKDQYDSQVLRDGDQIEVVTLVGGG
jgi:sulfur carrier protein